MKFVLSVALVATLCSCPANEAIQRQYVKADRATYDAISPVVRDLADDDAENDPDLSGVNGEALLMLVNSWDDRLTAAEASLDE